MHPDSIPSATVAFLSFMTIQDPLNKFPSTETLLMPSNTYILILVILISKVTTEYGYI